MADQLNLESIWAQHRAGLSAYLHARVDNPADAEELLQDMLVKTHDNIDMLSGAESLRAWLFRVARNSTIDFYRKRGREISPHPEDLWFQDADAEERHDLADCIVPFVDALPRDMGDLLRKVDLEGVPQKDYAAELGISYSTLKSRVQTARKRLRQVYESCCSFSLDGQGQVIDYRRKSGGCNSCD